MLSINQHPHNAKFHFENPVIFSIRICKSGVLCKGKIFSPCRFSIRFKLVTQIWYVNQQKAACVVSAVWCIATLLTMDNESFFNCKISLMWPRHYNIFKKCVQFSFIFPQPYFHHLFCAVCTYSSHPALTVSFHHWFISVGSLKSHKSSLTVKTAANQVNLGNWGHKWPEHLVHCSLMCFQVFICCISGLIKIQMQAGI